MIACVNLLGSEVCLSWITFFGGFASSSVGYGAWITPISHAFHMLSLSRAIREFARYTTYNDNNNNWSLPQQATLDSNHQGVYDDALKKQLS